MMLMYHLCCLAMGSPAFRKNITEATNIYIYESSLSNLPPNWNIPNPRLYNAYNRKYIVNISCIIEIILAFFIFVSSLSLCNVICYYSAWLLAMYVCDAGSTVRDYLPAVVFILYLCMRCSLYGSCLPMININIEPRYLDNIKH